MNIFSSLGVDFRPFQTNNVHGSTVYNSQATFVLEATQMSTDRRMDKADAAYRLLLI